MKSSAILLMAGSGTRTHLTYNKTLYEINNVPLFMYSLNKLTKVGFDEYIIVVSNSDYEYVCNYLASTPHHVKIVLGGLTRSESVKNAIKEVTTDVALIHDAARPLISIEDIETLKTTEIPIIKSVETYEKEEENSVPVIEQSYTVEIPKLGLEQVVNDTVANENIAPEITYIYPDANNTNNNGVN